MRYQKLGGGIITASNAVETVQMLREQSRNPLGSVQQFMNQTSEQCRIQTGAIISTYTPEIFVTDLVANGFLIEQV